MVGDTVLALDGMKVVSWNLTGSYEEQDGVRLAGLDESFKIVELLHDYNLDPRSLDDQCRKAVLTLADDMILFDAATGARLVEFNSPSRFRDFRFSPDGLQLWISFVHSKYDDDFDEDDGDEVDSGSEVDDIDEDNENEGGERIGGW